MHSTTGKHTDASSFSSRIAGSLSLLNFNSEPSCVIAPTKNAHVHPEVLLSMQVEKYDSFLQSSTAKSGTVSLSSPLKQQSKNTFWDWHVSSLVGAPGPRPLTPHSVCTNFHIEHRRTAHVRLSLPRSVPPARLPLAAVEIPESRHWTPRVACQHHAHFPDRQCPPSSHGSFLTFQLQLLLVFRMSCLQRRNPVCMSARRVWEQHFPPLPVSKLYVCHSFFQKQKIAHSLFHVESCRSVGAYAPPSESRLAVHPGLCITSQYMTLQYNPLLFISIPYSPQLRMGVRGSSIAHAAAGQDEVSSLAVFISLFYSSIFSCFDSFQFFHFFISSFLSFFHFCTFQISFIIEKLNGLSFFCQVFVFFLFFIFLIFPFFVFFYVFRVFPFFSFSPSLSSRPSSPSPKTSIFLEKKLSFRARFCERRRRKKERKKEERKKEERADRNRSPSTIARTRPFCYSRAWKPIPTIQYNTIKYNTLHCNTLRHSTAQYTTIQNITMQVRRLKGGVRPSGSRV